MLMNDMLSSDTNHLIPFSLWLISLVGIAAVGIVLFFIIKNNDATQQKKSFIHESSLFLFQVGRSPFLLLSICYLTYAVLFSIMYFFPQTVKHPLPIIHFSSYCLGIIEFTAFFWFVLNTLNKGKIIFHQWLVKNNKTISAILFSMIGNSLKASIILLMITIIVPALGFEGKANELLEKGSKVALVVILAWLAIELLNGLEKLILNQYKLDTKKADPSVRKINTQVLILKRVILSLIVVVSIAAVLMVFDSVKHLGEGLLTTAGIISAVGAFASQQSLGRIFAGLQLAFTQPIRIGDTVIIDNEFGEVEEITLSYVTIKLWDLRRLILPTDYFTNKGLQNLTHTSPELLGTIFLYVDYTLPTEKVRDKFNQFIQESPFWNKKTAVLQVTDMKQNAMELRAVVSAENASLLWNLRCELREKLIKFITEHHADCLPTNRNLNFSGENGLD